MKANALGPSGLGFNYGICLSCSMLYLGSVCLFCVCLFSAYFLSFVLNFAGRKTTHSVTCITYRYVNAKVKSSRPALKAKLKRVISSLFSNSAASDVFRLTCPRWRATRGSPNLHVRDVKLYNHLLFAVRFCWPLISWPTLHIVLGSQARGRLMD